MKIITRKKVNHHLLKNLGKATCYFLLGVVSDFFVVLYYRAIGIKDFPLAMLMAFILAVLPMIVVERGIVTKSRWIYFVYAGGTAIGTLLGMRARL